MREKKGCGLGDVKDGWNQAYREYSCTWVGRVAIWSSSAQSLQYTKTLLACSFLGEARILIDGHNRLTPMEWISKK